MIHAEMRKDGISCKVNGSPGDAVYEVTAVVSQIIDSAIQFDKEDGQRIAKYTVFEIMERIKAYTKREHGFDVLDISAAEKMYILFAMHKRALKENQ